MAKTDSLHGMMAVEAVCGIGVPLSEETVQASGRQASRSSRPQ